jgi:23S rRNA pseudouridine955/2504/2580 synthase/23S rRNA pseudouridine1911/1915/1917 synthase
MKRRNQFKIPPGAAPEALLDFLSRRFTYLSRETWDETIRRGRVSVNGQAADSARVLAAGDVVESELEGREEPPVDERFGVVFEDDDLLVADKPGNLPCHPSGSYFNHTLWALLKARRRIESPVMVNRLDRETSGLVVVAKNVRAAKLCQAEFAGRRVDKVYLALVEGLFPDERRASGAMRESDSGVIRKRRVFVEGVPPAESGGDWADTRFRRLWEGGGVSLVEVLPSTGRLHQIRATLLACGFPVVGDKVRGALTEADRARLRMDRQALHAARLRLRHPRTQKWLDLEAPLPADIKAVLRTCGHGAGKPEAPA